MRIIAGIYKGRLLFYDKSSALRPTRDQVREALFNVIQQEVCGSEFLDLFCGTGSVGLEAISRGAQRVVFVDKDTSIVQKNIQCLQIDSTLAVVYRGHFERFLSKNTSQFNIIYIDPPYVDLSYYEAALNGIYEFDILKSDGVIVCEHYKKVQLPSSIFQHCVSQHIYGDTVLTFIR